LAQCRVGQSLISALLKRANERSLFFALFKRAIALLLCQKERRKERSKRATKRAIALSKRAKMSDRSFSK